ncbi:mammalian ependymin-related protein 1 isoform X1 [Terrapene carolina triunguis]|uniref:Mammalian ependymin-related protein 1 n=1 Tax=Terrapene triunguis TaxID=2587831 RepID=A0A674J9X3_9SAUR|nr:mammalian ependymin-related protein 1 isoform X1 [Terrapene carolina triunguis]
MARGGGCLGQPRLLLLLLGGLLCLHGGAPLAAAPQGRAGRGQPPTPCQAPLQWEGRTVAYDHSSGRNTRAVVSYDGPNQRLRLLEERKGLIPCKKFFEYIFLYKDAVMFQIEQVTKLCSKIALTEPWDPYDIPDNSTYEDQYYIGGPGDEIMVQEWSDRKPARKFESWVGVYTVKDCYPVQETYTKNYSVTTSTRFFDLQLGITDPSVFTPPSTCQEAQPIKMKDEC